MSDIVIKVENVSKQYRLGKIGTGTFSHDLNRWWHTVRGKEDPYLKIGDVNDRSKKGDSEYVWALRNISFDVKHGEVLGIIGKNGAGKSTLLKILSRTTLPTTGSIKIKGRVASLLEVGTGFHPELTGRENIFLNGAILGMRKSEIKGKFDEIVDFSGVGKYIDTPVKRYSSGMYVRLAFAVAAHLEPDILIVDEVLAVGDAEFQKKALGKMKDVSQEQGRTVLFVSHNLSAINSLCTKCIYLKNGEIDSHGDTNEIINRYLKIETSNKTDVMWVDGNTPGDDIAILHSARLIDEGYNKIDFALIDKKTGIEFTYEVLKDGFCPIPNIHVYTSKGDYAFVSSEEYDIKLSKRGVYKTIMWIPGNLLNEGTYSIRIALTTPQSKTIHFAVRDTLLFDVIEDKRKADKHFRKKLPGIFRPKMEWDTIHLKIKK